MSGICNRTICAIGGFFGAAGVACYAAASHIGGFYDSMAPMLLIHAVLLIALSFLGIKGCFFRLGTWLIILGVILFTATLGFQQWYGFKLFPMAAPIGGTAIILGWIMFIAGALFSPKIEKL